MPIEVRLLVCNRGVGTTMTAGPNAILIEPIKAPHHLCKNWSEETQASANLLHSTLFHDLAHHDD
jgi:hypothetical protein